MAIPSSTYDEIVTTTIENYRGKLADNVLNHNPLLMRLKQKGNTDSASGGTKLLENLMYAENATFSWYTGLETLDVSQSDVLTSANFDWKQANANVVISGLEQLQNASREAKFNLLKSRIKVAEKTMMNNISAALFYSNTENDGKSIGGLQHLVADLPTSGTVGGIDASAQTWWRNIYYDFSTESVTPSSSTIQAAMNDVYIDTTRGSDKVDLIIGNKTYFTYYLESLQANQRFTGEGNDTAGSGFKSLKFWGGAADVIFDTNIDADRMYFLNTDYIHYRPHSERNFVTLDRKSSVNQDATVVPLYWAGNMTVSNRALQGVIVA